MEYGPDDKEKEAMEPEVKEIPAPAATPPVAAPRRKERVILPNSRWRLPSLRFTGKGARGFSWDLNRKRMLRAGPEGTC
jgi:hypothetical protein